ncbi:efflux RND transporter periplasmic adaptor subunit [Burkholderia sp. A1]|uniref:efflux RND transporter periplasmic adaptor subunit n=1 Tax=Burkholderia sp. A1 TaxID=148446 RepID=UPI00046A1378|nr:efflux RND transporter periplasmic adaptor subunit [Burkholderia sp. A1]
MNHPHDPVPGEPEPGAAPEAPEPAAAPRRRPFVMPLALAAAFAALLAIGIVPRVAARAARQAQTADQQALPVTVVLPARAPADQELILPGAVAPFADTAIYARTSGYVDSWRTDIGTRVKAGEVLARIAAPDLDAQLKQARADQAVAQANYDYAASTSERWARMLKTQSVSQQDADTRRADMNAKRALLEAAQANVAHLAQLVSFERVTAPFAGVVTARNVDLGTLVTAGGTPGSAGQTGELFHLQQTDRLRVFVDVPQDSAAGIAAGTGVYLSSPQYPGRRFAARVARSSGAIDPATRTLRVEIDVDNGDGALLPGAYARAHLQIASARPALELPVSALLFRPDGVTVATVAGDGRVALRRVRIGRDFGTRVEITTGLATSDRVIDNPGDALAAGERVQVMSVARAAPAATANTPAAPGTPAMSTAAAPHAAFATPR